MAKNSAAQIIKDQKKIIRELSTNANKSINEIAKTCGFSRQKVWRIIKNLENNNTIWGYTAVIDDEKQDMKRYMILIKRSIQPIADEIIDKIVDRELTKKSDGLKIDIVNSWYSAGAFDWVISFNAPDIKTAKRFVEVVAKLFEGYISDVQLIEELFPALKCGIQNPEIERLREYFGTN
jgi:DNA-binding Lrp family transcriptional regulator